MLWTIRITIQVIFINSIFIHISSVIYSFIYRNIDSSDDVLVDFEDKLNLYDEGLKLPENFWDSIK